MKLQRLRITAWIAVFLTQPAYSQNTCSSPVVISIPYYGTNATSCGNVADYSSGACINSVYANGEDMVYKYTPLQHTCLDIHISSVKNPASAGRIPDSVALYILDSCPTTPGASCIKSVQSSFSNARFNGGLKALNLKFLAGHAYYIIVDAGKSGNDTVCFNYTINITQIQCPGQFPPLSVAPQGVECSPNMGFDDGNFANWSACHYDAVPVANCPTNQTFPGTCPAICTSTSTVSGICTCLGCGAPLPPCCPLKCDSAGLVPGINTVNGGLGTCVAFPAIAGAIRHTVTNGSSVDPNSNGNIPVVAPGGKNYSARIGNHEGGYQAECLSYTFTVSSQNILFTTLYAAVLQDPAGHTDNERPRFQISFNDQNGNSPACLDTFEILSKNALLSGFENAQAPPCGGTDVWYKRWSAITVDLSPFAGQNMTVKYCTADCGQGGHFGYAYVDTYCKPLEIEGASLCASAASTKLTAPAGFAWYSWYSGGQPVSGNPISTNNDTLTVPFITGTVYTIKMESLFSPGCFSYITDTLQVVTCIPTEIKEEDIKNNISIHPNPNQGSFVLSGLAEGETGEVSVYDISGKIVYTDKITPVKTEYTLTLQLKEGIYFLKIKNSTGVKTGRILVTP